MRFVANASSQRKGGLPLPLAGEGWGGGVATLEFLMAEHKDPTWSISSKLRSNARALRKNSTDAERILWSDFGIIGFSALASGVRSLSETILRISSVIRPYW